MTNQQAKEILMLYRPGTADATDAEFTEALAHCERDAELKAWFDTHCSLYTAIRSKFKQVAVPEGLKEQIISERKVHTTPFWQRTVLAAGALAAAFLLVFTIQKNIQPREPHNFAAYRDFMGSFARRAYGMDTNTSNLDVIRSHFAQARAIADYVLPENLKSIAKATGCVATTWQGKHVSMICFQSGRQLPNPDNPNSSDLWLFISDSTIAKDAPQKSTPTLDKSNGLTSASWTVGNRTYILATSAGDEKFLEKFLPEKAVL